MKAILNNMKGALNLIEEFKEKFLERPFETEVSNGFITLYRMKQAPSETSSDMIVIDLKEAKKLKIELDAYIENKERSLEPF